MGAIGTRGDNVTFGVKGKSDAISENKDFIPLASSYANRNDN